MTEDEIDETNSFIIWEHSKKWLASSFYIEKCTSARSDYVEHE